MKRGEERTGRGGEEREGQGRRDGRRTGMRRETEGEGIDLGLVTEFESEMLILETECPEMSL